MSSTPSARTGPAPDAAPSTPSTPAAPQHRAVRDHRWVVLAVIGIAQLAVVLDATIVNIALPSAQQQLGFADDQRQWIVTAYSLAFGSLLLLGGRLGDLFGRKNLFVLGLAGFAAASVVGGLAQDFSQLVAAVRCRACSARSSPRPRSRCSRPPSPTRPNVPRLRRLRRHRRLRRRDGRPARRRAHRVHLLALVPVRQRRLRRPGRRRGAAVHAEAGRGPRPRLDLVGTVTITLGLVGIVYGFSSAETDGWSDPVTIASLVAGVVLVALFVLVESGVSHPLLPLRIVRDRDRGGALTAIGLVGVAMFGIFLFLTYYLTQTLGFSSLETGLSFLPMPLSIMTAATQITPRLLPRVGPKVLLRTGGLVAAAGILLFLRTDVDSTWAGTVLPASSSPAWAWG